MKTFKKLLATVLCLIFLASALSATVSAVTATPTASKVTVNGKNVAFSAYNIGGNNYFKLRDIAFALNGTAKQFEVGYDAVNNAITLTSGKAYTKVGGEMAAAESGNKNAMPTTAQVYLDGSETDLTAYNIGGNNYFKLRDLGQAIDFAVDYDGATNTIIIDTSKSYMSVLANQYKIIIDGKNVTQDMTLIEVEGIIFAEAESYFNALQYEGHSLLYSEFEYDEELGEYAVMVYSWYTDSLIYKMPVLKNIIYKSNSALDDTYDELEIDVPIVGSEEIGAWLPLKAISEFLDLEDMYLVSTGTTVKIEY